LILWVSRRELAAADRGWSERGYTGVSVGAGVEVINWWRSVGSLTTRIGS
jgi:hypothetical protein